MVEPALITKLAEAAALVPDTMLMGPPLPALPGPVCSTTVPEDAVPLTPPDTMLTFPEEPATEVPELSSTYPDAPAVPALEDNTAT